MAWNKLTPHDIAKIKKLRAKGYSLENISYMVKASKRVIKENFTDDVIPPHPSIVKWI